MTQLKIHWWNMTFHKRVAISVQISAWEGGNVVYSSAPGTSYSLNRLPIGSIITKASDSLYNITDSSSTVLWSITLTADSWYVIGGIKLNGQLVSSTPVTLNDWDILNPIFTMITMRITFYNGGLWDFYNELTGKYIYDWWYADVPRADELRFKSHSTANWIIEIYKDWDWRPVIDYIYNWQQAYIIAAPASAQVQSVEFVTDGGNTYTFPALWGLQSWYQYLDGSTFAFQNSPASCEVVELQSMSIQSTEFTQLISAYIPYQYPFIKQIQRWDAPQNWQMNYAFYDGTMFHMMGRANVMFEDKNHQMMNWTLIVAFSTDNKITPYCSIYDNDWRISDSYWIPAWSSVWLITEPNLWNDVYQNNSEWPLNYWMHNWQCNDVCELIQIIYNLATNK